MQKPTLASDLDDVHWPFLPNLSKFAKERYGIDLRTEALQEYDLKAFFGDNYLLRTLIRLNSFRRSEYSKQPIFTEGSLEILDSLKDYFSLHIVTSRSPLFRKRTRELISYLPPGIISAIHHSKQGKYFNGARQTKAQICKKIGAIALLEDNLVEALKCANEGIEVILLNAPWNKTTENHPKIKRVPNLAVAKDYALSLVGV